MKFTSEQIEKLKQICLERGEITLIGINGMGEKFETTGRIAVDDKGRPGVYEESIVIEFGKPSTLNDKRSEYYAPFKLNYETSLLGGVLIPFEIKTSDSQMIFTNTEQEVILELAQKERNIYQARIKREGKTVDKDDPVTSALRNMIAKPINMEGYKVVLLDVGGVTALGYVSIIVFQAGLIGSLFIQGDTKVFTESNDGEISLVAENTPYLFKKLQNERIAKVNEKMFYKRLALYDIESEDE